MLGRFCSSKYTSTLISRSIRVILMQSRVFRAKSADGFDDNHIYPASFALADQFIEFVTLFHTGAGDTLVGVNAYQLPAGFSVNPFCVVIHLILIAVELFVLLGGHSAVSGYPFGNALCAVRIHRLYSRSNGAYSLLQYGCCLLHRFSPF